jgi:hypothetical protein
MEDGTDRWHGPVSVVAAVAKYVDRAPVGVGSPVINVTRPWRTEEQASVLFVEAVAVTVADVELAVAVINEGMAQALRRTLRRSNSPLK